MRNGLQVLLKKTRRQQRVERAIKSIFDERWFAEHERVHACVLALRDKTQDVTT